MTRRSMLAVAWFVVGVNGTAWAQATLQDHKLDGYLRPRASMQDEDGVVGVIVSFRAGTGESAAQRLRAKGALFGRALPTIDAVAAQVPRSRLRDMVEDGDVLHVSHDSPVVADDIETTSVSGTAAGSSYTLRRTLGIDSVGSVSPLVGQGVTVAVIDSGIHPARDFQGRIAAFVDFTDETNEGATDPYGHGTHVSGTIGGRSRDVSGVATQVTLIGLRVLDANGVGTTSAVIRALQWAIDHRQSHAIDIVNLSLGHPVYEPAATDPLVQAVEAAVRAGLVVVVSAGNVGTNPETGLVGYAGLSSPGNAPSAITVGAIRTQDTTRRTDDLVADYSSRGPSWYDAFAKPDVVAPGHRVLAASSANAALYQAYPVLQGPSSSPRRQYLYLSGTSMATAVTTGAAALALEAGRLAFGATPTPRQVKAMLMLTAFRLVDTFGAPYDLLTQGAGAVNGGGLVALASALDPTSSGTIPVLIRAVGRGRLSMMSRLPGETTSCGAIANLVLTPTTPIAPRRSRPPSGGPAWCGARTSWRAIPTTSCGVISTTSCGATPRSCPWTTVQPPEEPHPCSMPVPTLRQVGTRPAPGTSTSFLQTLML